MAGTDQRLEGAFGETGSAGKYQSHQGHPQGERPGTTHFDVLQAGKSGGDHAPLALGAFPELLGKPRAHARLLELRQVLDKHLAL